MKEVEFSYVIEGTEAEIREHLSPREIAEYMGYSVQDVERRTEDELLRVGKYDTEFTLKFQDVSDGHEFSQYGSDGPFQKLDGILLIEDAPDVQKGDASKVTVNITYTIGTLFSFLLNRLAGRIVKRDAEHLLQSLASNVAEGRKSDRDSAENEEDGQRDEEREAVSDKDDPWTDGNPSE